MSTRFKKRCFISRRATTVVVLAHLFLLSSAVFAQLSPVYEPVEANGLAYANLRIDESPWSIHILRIDRTAAQFELQTGIAQGRVYGLEQVSTIARRTAFYLGMEAVAAINGDWFVIDPDDYQGLPRGLMIMNGELIRDPCVHYPAFMIDADGEPRIQRTRLDFRVTWPDGTETPFTLNDRRSDSAAVVYTPALGLHRSDRRNFRLSTRTAGGREIRLTQDGDAPFLPVEIGSVISARVDAISARGNLRLLPDALILSLGPELLPHVPTVETGDVLRLAFTSNPDISGMRAAVGGGTVLVRDGKMMISEPRPDETRHPRTMIGWNDRYYFFTVVDGRQPGLSIGMHYYEMAKLMHDLGCNEALELDGGGSSALWLNARGVVNSPSDRWPRNVATAVVLLRKPDGDEE